MKARFFAVLRMTAAPWILVVLGTTGCAWLGPGCTDDDIIDSLPSVADWLDEHGCTGCSPLLHQCSD